MKIVINKCYGGFGLSPLAIKRLAELDGRDCYFFTHYDNNGKHDLDNFYPTTIEDIEGKLFFSAFDIPVPPNHSKEEWSLASLEERKQWNNEYDEHLIFNKHNEIRSNPRLVQVVEELGAAANGNYSELAVIEIPDDIEWEIEEYDGLEHIAQKHQTWG